MFMVVAVEDKKEPLRQRLGRLLRGDALEWEDRSCGGNRYRYHSVPRPCGPRRTPPLPFHLLKLSPASD